MQSILKPRRSRRAVAAAAAALLATMWLAAPARAVTVTPGSFGDVYPRGNPDGVISLGDLLLVRAFALGAAVPSASELNAANVFPLASCPACLPTDPRAPDFNARILGGFDNTANDAGDITIADVLIIEKVILGQITLGSGLGLISAGAINPSSGDTAGGQPLTISGNGFQTNTGQSLRVGFIFPQPSGPEHVISCDVPNGTAPVAVTCSNGAMHFISVSNSQIQMLTPDATAEMPPGESEVSAAVQVSIVQGATVLQSTSNVLTAQNSYTFARGALQITALGGEKQAGFPLIELGSPLTTFVYDLVALKPATSYTTDPLTAPYVTLTVDISNNCPALLNGSEFDLTLPIGADGKTQVTLTPLDDCTSHKIVVTAAVTNLFGTPVVGVSPTFFNIPVAQADQGVLQVVSGAGQICPYDTTCAVDLTAGSPVPQPLTVSIIDRFGIPVQGGAGFTVKYLMQSASGGLTNPTFAIGAGTDSCNAPGAGPSIQCTETGSAFLAVNFTAGHSNSSDTGDYVVQVNAVGNPLPATFTNVVPVIPADPLDTTVGLYFRIRAERPVGTTIEYANEATESERQADISGAIGHGGPFPMSVKVRDQWGRLAASAPGFPLCVTYNAITTGFATPPVYSYTTGNPAACPADQQIDPNQVAVEAAAGTVAENLTFTNASQGGILTVHASISSRPSEGVDFKFALGLINRPPPPVNLSRVEVFPGIQNTIAPAAGGDGTSVSSFIVRGALGSVVKGIDDIPPFGSGNPPTFTRYSVQVTDGGAVTGCANVTNGITGGVGLDNTGDVNQGRFQVTLSPEPVTGQLAVSVWDQPGCTGEQSIPRLVSYTSRFDVGYVSNRTLSQLDRLGLDFTGNTPSVTSVDTDQTFGTQSIRTTGLAPLGIAYFSTDPAAAGPDGQPLMDRAIVVNNRSGDLSVVRVAEEVMVQGNDLNLVGNLTGNVVESLNSDFLVERNYTCNHGVSLTNYLPDTSDDCSVAPGDILVVRPGEAIEVKRIIRAVLGTPGQATQLVLNGDLNPIQVSSPGVNFRIISRYREIDADNDWCTTSRRAESGVSRVKLPYPDRSQAFDSPPSGPCPSGQYAPGADEPDLVAHPGRLLSPGVTLPVSPRYVAAWFPSGGITSQPDLMGRVFVSDPAYNVLYVFDVITNADGQYEFIRPDTNVPTSGAPQPDGVIPMLALRTPEYSAPLSFAGPTQLVADAQDSDGDLDIDDQDDTYLYVVVESDPGTGGPIHGGLSVFALNPDPDSVAGAGLEWTDGANIRFPFQTSTSCGGSACYLYKTALCQDNDVSREWVACEVDTDFDPYTNSYATTRPNVCFDQSGDGVPDGFIASTNTTCGGTANVDSVSVPVPSPSIDTGITMILARQTNLTGDFLSDQFTLSFTEFSNPNPVPYRDNTRPLRFWQPFRFEKPYIPASLDQRVRRDVGFLSVRTNTNDPVSDNLNDRPQLVYPVDVRPDRSRLIPGVANSGLPSSAAGLTIAFDTPLAGTGPGGAYADARCVLDPNSRLTTGAGQDQRDEDDIVTVPSDRNIAVTGLGGNGLWGPDSTRGTSDDLIQPQDVLLLETTLHDRVYRYTVVKLHDTDKFRFVVRADSCDGTPSQAVVSFRILDSMNVIDLGGNLTNQAISDLPVGISMSTTSAARGVSLTGGIGRSLTHFSTVRDNRDTTSGINPDRDDRFTLFASVSMGQKDATSGITPTTVSLVDLYDPGADANSLADDLGCLRFGNGLPDSGPLTVAQQALCTEMEGENDLVPGDPVINLAAPTLEGGAIVMAASDQLGFLFNSSSSQVLQFRHRRQAADVSHSNLPWLKASPYPALTYPETPFEASEAYPNLIPGDGKGLWSRTAYDSLSTDVRQRFLFTNPVSNVVSVVEQRAFTGIATPIYVGQSVDTDNITGAQSIRIDSGLITTGPAQRIDKIEKSFFYGTSVGGSALFVLENLSDTSRYDLDVVDPQVDTELDQNTALGGTQGLSSDTTPNGNGADINVVVVDEGRERVYLFVNVATNDYQMVVYDLNTGTEISLVTGIPECANNHQIRFTTEPLSTAVPQTFTVRDNLLLAGYSAGNTDDAHLFWLNLDNLKSADFVSAANGGGDQCIANFVKGVTTRTVSRASPLAGGYATSVEAIRIDGDRALVAGSGGGSLKLSVIDLTQFWRWSLGSGCAESGATACAPRDAALIPSSGSSSPTLALTLETGASGKVTELRSNGTVAFVTVKRVSAPLNRVYIVDTVQYTATRPPNGGANVDFFSPLTMATVDAPGQDPVATIVGPSWLVIPNKVRDSSGNNLTLVNLKSSGWNRTTPPAISGGSIKYYPAGSGDGEIRDFEFTTLPPP